MVVGLDNHRFPDRSLAGQPLDGFRKADAVEVLHQIDDVAALGAVPAVPNLLLEVDRETVGAAATLPGATTFTSLPAPSCASDVEAGTAPRKLPLAPVPG